MNYMGSNSLDSKIQLTSIASLIIYSNHFMQQPMARIQNRIFHVF